MQPHCHRCGATLGQPGTFCPSCGAPQLRLQPSDEAVGLAGVSGDGVQAPQVMSWKQAIVAASVAAVPMGVLSSSVLPVASMGCCLWVVGGSIAAVGLYHRRAAKALLDMQTGLKIGAVSGLLAAFVASALNGFVLLFQRYALHTGSAIDTTLATFVDQIKTKMAQATPEVQAQMQDYIRFLLSPEGKAAWFLMGSATAAAGIVLFAAAGGALGAKIFAGQRNSLRSS